MSTETLPPSYHIVHSLCQLVHPLCHYLFNQSIPLLSPCLEGHRRENMYKRDEGRGIKRLDNNKTSARYSLLISSSLSLLLSYMVPKFYLVPHDFTAPFGRPSASLEFLHSLSLSTRSVQNTIPEGVLSSCGCALTLTLTTSQGVYGRVRVPRNLHSLFYDCPVLDSFPSDFYFSR